MCYNLSVKQSSVANYANHIGAVFPTEEVAQEATWQPHFLVSGFDHPVLPIFTKKGAAWARWGLIPRWVKNADQARGIQDKTLNAVSKTVFEKPSFKQSIKDRRCLIVVDGFFEWRTFDKVKYPYYVYPSDRNFFVFGGIYDEWVDKLTGKETRTFSILTTEANPLMANVHNMKRRMPLILPQENWDTWLEASSEEHISALMKPIHDRTMEAHSVGRWINHAHSDRDRAEAHQEVYYPELALLPIR